YTSQWTTEHRMFQSPLRRGSVFIRIYQRSKLEPLPRFQSPLRQGSVFILDKFNPGYAFLSLGVSIPSSSGKCLHRELLELYDIKIREFQSPLRRGSVFILDYTTRYASTIAFQSPLRRGSVFIVR